MSRMLWVWFSYRFEGIRREVALQQRPLLTAPQSYFRGQRRRAHLVGEEDPNHPPTPLHFPEEPLQHVRRAYPSVVASRVVKVAQRIAPIPASNTATAFAKRFP